MKYPDFVVSKTIPTQHQTSCFKYITAVLRVKVNCEGIASINRSLFHFKCFRIAG